MTKQTKDDSAVDEASLLTQPDESIVPHTPGAFTDRPQSPTRDTDEADTDSSQSSSPPSPSLAERRALNIQRNAALLRRLGLQHGVVPRHMQRSQRRRVDQRPELQQETHATSDRRPVGMLLTTRRQKHLLENDTNLDTIYQKYPHRETQLRKLLGSFLATSSHSSYYVPPPIFCHGPPGTGKTAIITDILELMDDHRTAYINCATMEPNAGAEQIVSHISKQLFRSNNERYGGDQSQRETMPKVSHQSTEVKERKRARLSRSHSTKSTEQYNTYSLQADMSSSTESTGIPLCAVWNFGRELRARLSKDVRLVVVLDHAEMLMNMAANSTKNFLAQLMLLPQVLNLNMTVVAVSNSYLLQETRIDSLCSAHLSQATIVGDVHPIVVHFTAYRRKQLQTILCHPLVRQSIIGRRACSELCSVATAFAPKVYNSFVDLALQNVHGRINNIKEIIQLFRSWWPHFLQPLTEKRFEKLFEEANEAVPPHSFDAIDPSAAQREVLTLLSKQAHVLLRNHDSIMFRLPESPHQSKGIRHELPALAKYLMLSLYLCQVNHVEKDKQLFGNRKSVRRREQDVNRDEQEELAFGSNSEKHLSRAIRPRTFPLERVLSVFNSLVRLTHCSDTGSRLDGEMMVSCTLASLREMGILREYPVPTASDTIRLIDPRYYSTMTEEDAKKLANAVNFPLEKFTQ